MTDTLTIELREQIAKLKAENERLRTVMVAAAEEIHAHWDAHCDADGYGPANLMRRLEDGIAAQYGYTVGAFAALTAERDALRDTMALHEVGSAYAHRLAVLLECALLDPFGTWADAHALLDEYRAACRVANPEPPTFMGEPVVPGAARKEAP